MKQRLKQYALVALAAALLWFLLDTHIVISGHSVHFLKKSTLDLHDTFVSLDRKKPESMLENDRLREAGIGDLLVELEIISPDELAEWENVYDDDD